LVGKGLGQMKDELDGMKIKQAYFLDIKKYGYWYLDKKGNKIEKSVFAGVERDSLSFQEIKDVYEGKVLTKNIPNRFYKSLNRLEIVIRNTHIQIDNKSYKSKVGNKYLPLYVNTIDSDFKIFIDKHFNKIINQINRINKLFKH
jgi:hypothetical protein